MEAEVFYSHLKFVFTTSEPISYGLMDYPGTYIPVRVRRQNDFTLQVKEPRMLLERD